VQRELREGHTIGSHTQHHPHLNHVPVEVATKEIEDGIASIGKALGGSRFVAPFFRFPYLDGTPATEASAMKMGLTIWNADLHASDWNRITPAQEAGFAITRLERRKKGILLLHDIHERTALALPILLHELKGRGFQVVHAIPAGPDHPKTVAKPDEWIITN
jgi:peptidoglycan/xylan/chitin deacetylase (PgdA/CDA1 family)